MLRALAVVALVAGVGAQDLREDWIERDLALVPQIRTALARTDLDGFVATLRTGDTREDRDVGFGARRLCVAVYGGYTTVWVRALVVDGTIAAVDAFFDVSETSWDASADRLLAAWDTDASLTDHGFRAARSDARPLLALRRKLTAALGPTDASGWLPDALRPALTTLTDPLADLTFGTACFEDGEPPPGRPEITALVDAGRLDLVRRVLRSPNAEARVYAAEALLRKGVELDDADRAALEQVRALPIGIACCAGCELLTRTARELLPPLR